MIKYEPSELLKKIAPASKIKKLLSKKVTLKKTALAFVDAIDFLRKRSIAKIALQTIKGYEKRIEEEPSIKADLLKDPKQLIQRVQNEVVFQLMGEIKNKYRGEFYIWLPSDAKEPSPEHQLKYGKRYQIGVGEMPGQRFGCRCGMEILTSDSSLEI